MKNLYLLPLHTVPSPLIFPSQPLSHAVPEVQKQLDNKSILKGHTPTLFMLASPSQPSKKTKKSVCLVTGQACVSAWVSGCRN